MPGALASPVVFDGSELQASEPIRLETTLDFAAEDFHGHVATIEWLRRLTGPQHARFLDEVQDALARDHPGGVADPSEEHLILARRR